MMLSLLHCLVLVVPLLGVVCASESIKLCVCEGTAGQPPAQPPHCSSVVVGACTETSDSSAVLLERSRKGFQLHIYPSASCKGLALMNFDLGCDDCSWVSIGGAQLGMRAVCPKDGLSTGGIVMLVVTICGVVACGVAAVAGFFIVRSLRRRRATIMPDRVELINADDVAKTENHDP